MNDVRAYPPHPQPPPVPPPPLGAGVEAHAHPDPATARALYRGMLTSRLLEERIVELYRLGKITGGCYTGIGNEATSVGAASALDAGDVLVPTHRDMGAHLVRGHAPLDILRQYFKKGTSQTEGKDSGLHIGREGGDVIGMISHLAHMLPVAVGIALAEKQKGTNAAVLATVGDGSTSLGDFHEALNFAAVQKLPVLFIIQNNQYAYSTPITLQYACARLSDRAAGYGMPGAQIDGTDVISVLAAARAAIARGRRGEGPTLLESVTMRLRGHSEHDDFKYVPSELIDRWRRWDPVERCGRYLVERGIADLATIEAERRAIGVAVDAAIDAAAADPAPDPAAAGRDVYRRWSPEWTVPSGEAQEGQR